MRIHPYLSYHDFTKSQPLFYLKGNTFMQMDMIIPIIEHDFTITKYNKKTP